MNLNKKEINFINECIDLYWEGLQPPPRGQQKKQDD